MHKHLYTFKATSAYEMGYAMGSTFKLEAHNAVEAAIANHNWGKMVDRASLMLDISKTYFSQYIAELEGYAKGASIDFLEFWTLCLESDVDLSLLRDQCTSIITNKGLLAGHNEDAEEPNLEDTVCLVKKQLNNFSTFEIFYFNTLGGAAGITSHGYFHCANTLYYMGLNIGVPRNICSRYLFDSPNPSETLAFLNQLPRAAGYNHNILSFNGSFLNAEITSKSLDISKPVTPFIHTNHCLLTHKTPHQDDYGTNSRLVFAKSATQNQMSVADLKSLLSNKNSGPVLSVNNERTVAMMICDLNRRMLHIWLKRESECGWIEYPLEFLNE